MKAHVALLLLAVPLAPSVPVKVPIACRPAALNPAERARSAALREALARSVAGFSELPDGYAFQLSSAGFAAAAEWIPLERRCCPFLSFTLEWASGDGLGPSLALTGPEGTKGFLAEELPVLATPQARQRR